MKTVVSFIVFVAVILLKCINGHTISENCYVLHNTTEALELKKDYLFHFWSGSEEGNTLHLSLDYDANTTLVESYDEIVINKTHIKFQEVVHKAIYSHYVKRLQKNLSFGWNKVNLVIGNDSVTVSIVHSTYNSTFSWKEENDFDELHEVFAEAQYFAVDCNTDQLVWRANSSEFSSPIPLNLNARNYTLVIESSESVNPILQVQFCDHLCDEELTTSNLTNQLNISLQENNNHLVHFYKELNASQGHKYVMQSSSFADRKDQMTFQRNITSISIACLNEEGCSFYFSNQRVLQGTNYFHRTNRSKSITIFNEHNTIFAPITTTSPPLKKDMSSTVYFVIIWVLVIVIVFLLIIVCSIGCKGIEQNNIAKSKSIFSIDVLDDEEKARLLSTTEDQYGNFMVRRQLWDYVALGNIDQVTKILEERNINESDILNVPHSCSSSPYEEAQKRNYTAIIELFDKKIGQKNNETCSNNVILNKLLKDYTDEVNSVFTVAGYGQYSHKGGVDMLLRSSKLQGNRLPGNIRDSKGKTILHYAASISIGGKGPLWRSEDIAKLVNEHSVFVNAKDYEGRTPLHDLAMINTHCLQSKSQTFWQDKSMKTNTAWMSLVDQLVGLGCNPQARDNDGATPRDLAKSSGNTTLAFYLKKLEYKTPCPTDSYEDITAHHKHLMRACEENNINEVKAILNQRPYKQPIGIEDNPLTKAINIESTDITCMLLSADCSVFSRFYNNQTVFHKVHNDPLVKHIFTVIVRKEFYNRLMYECERIDEATHNTIKSRMISFANCVLEEGITTSQLECLRKELLTLIDEEELVNYVSKLGLTLVCQFLGYMNINFYSSSVSHNPLLIAYSNNHMNTFDALIGDNRLIPSLFSNNPICFNKSTKEMLLKQELKIVESSHVFGNEFNEEQITNYIREVVNGEKNISPPSKEALYAIAQYGLVTCLQFIQSVHEKLNLCGLACNDYGFSLVHIAAAFGQTKLIEFIMFNGYDIDIESKSGLYPIQIAAVREQKECLDYLHKVCKTPTINMSFPPTSVYNEIQNNLPSHVVSICKPVPSPSSAKIFKRSLSFLGFPQDTSTNSVEISIRTLIEDDLKILSNGLCTHDDRLRGSFVSLLVDNQTEGLDNYFKISCLKTSCFKYTFYYFYDLHEKCIHDDRYLHSNSIKMLPTTEDADFKDFFQSANYRSYFIRALENAVNESEFKHISIIPPFVNCKSLEVFLNVMFVNGSFARQYVICIVPSVFCKSKELPSVIPPKFTNLIDTNTFIEERTINNHLGIWKHSYFSVLQNLFVYLSPNEKKVFEFCLLLVFHITKDDHSIYARKVPKPWAVCKNRMFNISFADVAKTIKQNILKMYSSIELDFNFNVIEKLCYLFLEELKESNEVDWNDSNIMSRIISTLERTKKLDLFVRCFSDLNDAFTEEIITRIKSDFKYE